MLIIKKISIFVLVTSFFMVPVFVLAQPKPTTPPAETSIKGHIENPFKGGDDLMVLITTILEKIIMPIAVVAVVLWIIYAGFTFLTAQGNPTEIEKAQQRLLWSLIGAGILLGAVGIAKAVESTIKALINTQ